MGGRGAARGTKFAGTTSGGGSGATSTDERDDLTTAFFNGEVDIEDYGAKEKAYLRKIFGREITPEELANLSGAPDGATISIDFNSRRSNSDQFQIHIDHPYLTEMTRMLYRDDTGNVVLKNDMFFLEYKRDNNGDIIYKNNQAQTLAPPGFGTASFARQVDSARAAGVSYIRTYALRSDDPVEPAIGSYVWARLGYDAPLSQRTQSRLLVDPRARNFRNVRTLNELMSRGKEAREWWRDNHQSFSGIFSLERGSTSLRVFNSYKRQRGIRTGIRTPGRDRGTGFGRRAATNYKSED